MNPEIIGEYLKLLKEYKVPHDPIRITSALMSGSASFQQLSKGINLNESYHKNLDMGRQQQKEGVDQFLALLMLVQYYVEQIQFTIKLDNITIPKPFIAGVFPTQSFNAQAISTGNGALLLLNLGLFGVIGNTINLISYDKEYERLLPQQLRNSPTIKLGLENREILSRNEIAKLLLIEITQYLLLGNPLNIAAKNVQNKIETQIIRGFYVQAIELFALAHEFAHLILGHLDENRTALTSSNEDQTIKYFTKSQKQELEADKVAFFTLMMGSLDAQIKKAISMKEEPSGNTIYNLFIYNSAPILFFLIDDLISSVRNRLTNRNSFTESLSHPPSKMRIGQILNGLLQTFQQLEKAPDQQEIEKQAQIILGPVSWCIEWFEDVQKEIMQLIDNAD